MAQDRLVVFTDHPSTGIRMNFTPVDLNRDDLTDKALEVIIGVWGWTPEDMRVNGDEPKSFLINPELWNDICRRVQWPDVSDKSQEVRDAVTRCKISVYKTMKLRWVNERVMAYAGRSEAHYKEIFELTGGI